MAIGTFTLGVCSQFTDLGIKTLRLFLVKTINKTFLMIHANFMIRN